MSLQCITKHKVYVVAFSIILVLTVVSRIFYSKHLHGLLCATKTFQQYASVVDRTPTQHTAEPIAVAVLPGKELTAKEDKAIVDNFQRMQRILVKQKKTEKLLWDRQESKDFQPPKGEQVLPQAIIVGVRKCGTRALLEMLETHPQIAASGPEVHFFDRNYERGLDWYRLQMKPSTSDQITIGKSPSYFITDGVPKRIYKMNKNTLILVILREPTVRLISDFTQIAHKEDSWVDGSTFEETVLNNGRVRTSYKAVQISTYANYIDNWLEYFPLRRIHFVDGDKLISDPLPEMKKVEKFLGIANYISEDNFYYNATRGFYCLAGERNSKCLASGKGREHPNVSADVIELLHAFFRPHNKRLYNKIQVQFDWP